MCYTLHINLPVLTGNSNGAIRGWNHYTTFLFDNNKNNNKNTTTTNNIIIISVIIIIIIIIIISVIIIIMIIIMIIILILIIIMKSYITRYPQLHLGHNALIKTYDQNNKAPKIKRHTHAQNHP